MGAAKKIPPATLEKDQSLDGMLGGGFECKKSTNISPFPLAASKL
jgi:hypothetical protein